MCYNDSVVCCYIYGLNEMDKIFVDMFGERYARSFYLMTHPEVYFKDDPKTYEDDEKKKECISEMLLDLIEYYKNKDTVWYD